MKTDIGKQVLLYHYSSDFNGRFLEDLTIVNSPVTCLQKAVRNSYDLIVIFQNFRSLKARFALIKLCSKLKKNPETGQIPLLCILAVKHRGVLEQLRNVGADYARFFDQDNPISKNELAALVESPSENCRIERVLSRICHYINYFPISRHQEIMYCGAYRNRLVLGPQRLQNICETKNHKNCQYFK